MKLATEALESADLLKKLLITSQINLKPKPPTRPSRPSPPSEKPYFDISRELQQLGLELKRQSPEPVTVSKPVIPKESYPS